MCTWLPGPSTTRTKRNRVASSLVWASFSWTFSKFSRLKPHFFRFQNSWQDARSRRIKFKNLVRSLKQCLQVLQGISHPFQKRLRFPRRTQTRMTSSRRDSKTARNRRFPSEWGWKVTLRVLNSLPAMHSRERYCCYFLPDLYTAQFTSVQANESQLLSVVMFFRLQYFCQWASCSMAVPPQWENSFCRCSHMSFKVDLT